MEKVWSEDVWVGRIENRYFTNREEFLNNVNLGLEVEFIVRGIGYFLSSPNMKGKRVFLLYCAYTQTSQYFKDSEELLQASLNGIPLEKCWDEIEIVSF